MESATQSRPYQTEKLTFAAYLIASDKAQLVGTEAGGRGKNVRFLLSRAPAQEETTSFFNGSAQVSALRFAEAMSTLKAAAYEGRQSRGSV